MIYVQLNKADFEYDIHSLVKAFFPAEEVLVTAEEKQVDERISFRLAVTYETEPDQIRFDIIEDDIVIRSAKTDVDFADRKGTKNKLKQALDQLLEAYSGQTLPWGTLTGIRPTKIPMSMLEEGKSEEEITSYMKETYFASDEKIDLSIQVAQRELELLQKIDYENGYSLYIGIPFCPSTCLYCSFTSYPIGLWSKRVDEYLDALEKEIDFTAEKFRDKHLNSIYIGGGTPTTLSPEQLDRLITKIENSFDFSHLLEFTVEAGRPDSITEEKLLALRISVQGCRPGGCHQVW